MSEVLVTMSDQIACVRRELAMRKIVYPKWVAAGRMKQRDADIELGRMTAVLGTLIAIAQIGRAYPYPQRAELGPQTSDGAV